MVLVVTVPGTCSFVVVVRAAATLSVVVSIVVLKVTVSAGSGTVLELFFLLGGSSLVTGSRFRFGDGWNSGFSGSWLTPPEYSSSSRSFSAFFSMRLVLDYICLRIVACRILVF